MLKASPEFALKYTQLSVSLMFTWPPWPESGKSVKFFFNFFSWISVAVALVLVILLCNTARYQLDNLLNFTKTICLAVSCSQALIKILICKRQRSTFEILYCQVKDFIKNATPCEREMLQYYVDRCGPVHFVVTVCAVFASLAMICGPVVLPQSLPTDVIYPFSIEKNPAWALAYLHQALAGLQCAGISAVDCQMAVLIWFAGARFELLANEFKNVTDAREFNRCVRKHQILLRNAEEIVRAVRYIVVTTSTMTTASIIFGAIHIVSQQPILVKSQFIFIDLGFASVLFMSAWPSENLLSACQAVGEGAYNCPWVLASPEIRKNITMVVQRSQKPIVISVSGVLPQLSLTYYSAFLSKTLSFFTTLRLIIDKVEEEI